MMKLASMKAKSKKVHFFKVEFHYHFIFRLWRELLLAMGLTALLAAALENMTGFAAQMASTVLPLKMTALLSTSSTWQDWRPHLRRFDLIMIDFDIHYCFLCSRFWKSWERRTIYEYFSMSFWTDRYLKYIPCLSLLKLRQLHFNVSIAFSNNFLTN